MSDREDKQKAWDDAKAQHAKDKADGKVKDYRRPTKKADRDKLRAERIAYGTGA